LGEAAGAWRRRGQAFDIMSTSVVQNRRSVKSDPKRRLPA
jgi:hypothetical protein